LGLLGLSVASGLLSHTPLATPGWPVDGFAVLILAAGWKSRSKVRDGVERLPVALLVPLLTALGGPTPTDAEVVKAVQG
ncbi:MAG: hypothetical protein GXP62_12780, partial [Oligoflexia bacterium]|nr:hypothetical protein [Oligoflexia bacterium]